MQDQPLSDLLKQLGAKTPTPGGGAAAAWVGALGSALAQMAMRYSIRKKTPIEDRVKIETFISEALSTIDTFLESAQKDAVAYEYLNQLQKLDGDDPKRLAGWEDAVKEAIAVPSRVVETAVTSLNQYESFMTRCNQWLLSDLAIAAILCESAARAGAWNVRINLSLIDDTEMRDSIRVRLNDQLTQVHVLTAHIEEFCAGAD